MPIRRVLSDNGIGYVAHVFRAACTVLGVRHMRTRSYTPRTNGKAERFLQTLLGEWAYVEPYASSRERRARRYDPSCATTITTGPTPASGIRHRGPGSGVLRDEQRLWTPQLAQLDHHPPGCCPRPDPRPSRTPVFSTWQKYGRWRLGESHGGCVQRLPKQGK